MEDLNEKLERLLSDPQGIAKIQQAMAALSGEAAPPQPEPEPEPPAMGGLPDLSGLTRLMPLLSQMGQDNDDTRLLQALRPYLKGHRAGRLEESVQLLRLVRLIPLLQEQGMLKGGNYHGG